MYTAGSCAEQIIVIAVVRREVTFSAAELKVQVCRRKKRVVDLHTFKQKGRWLKFKQCRLYQGTFRVSINYHLDWDIVMYAWKVLIKALVSKIPQFICRAAFEKRWANIESERVVPGLILVLISNRMEIEHFVLHAFTAALYFAGC